MKQNKFLAKSLTHRNFEAAKKLDQMEALKRWAEEKPIPIPKFDVPKAKKSIGAWNLIRQLRM